MEAGLHYDLNVLRKTEIGYILTNGKEEIFLHNNEVVGEIEEGQSIRVFLYFDSSKRIAATMQEALITTQRAGWVKVKNVVKGLGVFVHCGINKDMLIATEFLPYDFNAWPQIDDSLFCILKNKGLLNAKIVNQNDSKEYMQKETILLHDEVMAYVTRINNEGIGLYTKNLTYIYVHKTQMRRTYRLGEEVMVSIMAINERGYQGTLIKQKENMINEDATEILEYINEHNGIMNYDSDSSAEDILRVFNMSKKAFKRALGHLYKERTIYFEEGQTILSKECKK